MTTPVYPDITSIGPHKAGPPRPGCPGVVGGVWAGRLPQQWLVPPHRFSVVALSDVAALVSLRNQVHLKIGCQGNVGYASDKAGGVLVQGSVNDVVHATCGSNAQTIK